jgi:hypothetical protein
VREISWSNNIIINKGFLLFMSIQKYYFHLYFNKKLCYARYGIENTFKME